VWAFTSEHGYGSLLATMIYFPGELKAWSATCCHADFYDVIFTLDFDGGLGSSFFYPHAWCKNDDKNLHDDDMNT
jgi:hypothetical protein